MSDLPVSLPTLADIDRHGSTSDDVKSSELRRYKPEVKITFERKAMATRFQRLPSYFDHARLRYETADNVRHRPTPETKMSATKPEVETGSGNNC